jgi:small-conductance mechanosensitive channel
VARVQPADTLQALAESLLTRSALTEAGILLGCLAVAGLLVRLLRPRSADSTSIWFGRKGLDGVLFPVLALALAYVARRLLQGTLPVAVFNVAVPILMSLVAIRVTARVLHAAFPRSTLVRAVERTVSWLAWLGVVLWITGVLPLLLDELEDVRWKIGGTQVTLRSLIEGAFSAVVVLMVALWISAAVESRLLKGAAAADLSLRKIAANGTRALLLFLGLLLALSAAGIDLTALSVLGGAVGVGIGFGLQKLAANYVSGFVILAERSLRIGDIVKVDGFEGRIADIATRYTVIRALNGRESLVPNEMLLTQRIENASLSDRNMLLSSAVQVAYGTDVPALVPALCMAVSAVPRVLADPGPAVHLTGFGADGLELNVLYWIGDPENGQGNVRSDVNLAVLACLNRLGVEIPYPQRVVRTLEPATVGATPLSAALSDRAETARRAP